jgi:DNA polymerase-1
VRFILCDADIPLHRFSHVNQHAIDWDESTWSYYGDLGQARVQFARWIEHVEEVLDANETVICLSDNKANWRHDVMPTYKGHRASWAVGKRPVLGELPKPGPARPLLHAPLRAWLRDEYGAMLEPSLEADDLLGLLATKSPQGTAIMVTADKDLRTVPGLHWNPDRAAEGLVSVSPEEADWFHLTQTLVGDATDGYKGCPGVGPKTAATILGQPARGAAARAAAWDGVVHAFERKGLTEEDALTQARVARVLRGDEYDFVTKEIQLWTP